MITADVTIRRRRTTVLYGVVALVIAALAASAMDMSIWLGLGLALCAAAFTAMVAPPRRAWISGNSIVIGGWTPRRQVPLSEVEALAVSRAHVHPPTLEIIHAGNKAIGPIFLEESSRPFVAEFVAAMDASGRAQDRYIRENLDWLRRF